MTLVLALGFGAVIGVLLGLLGGGGSILAVPALVFGLGLSMAQAIPISLIVVGVASAVGVLPKVRARQVEWRLAGIFAATGIPATFAGSAVGRLLPERALLIGFAVVMVLAGARMLADRGDTGTACSTEGSRINWRRCAPRSIAAGLTVGFLTGLFGVGGGFLIIPALVLMLGIEMPVAVGTSLVIIVANSAAGLISHLSGTSIDWAITAAFAGTAIVGSLVAGQFGTRIDTDRLQRWFAYLVFAVAAYVLVDAIFLR
ncbi:MULTISPECIES: sulfite exporter TauE/SafE family protein [Rhodococcus]|uniref:sulfite exporter TauE/SafE family protein n=2 Tax=Nocardiaceae TaxID=85025 RepID=UPI000903103E|nr:MULTISPECIES: sulfite exporter TauE/SafE family protein [Rhodococcus]APE07882.1 permease [Rhodococcus sp. 2G]AYA25234.1 sulfite exporter TauE/SafE family protein [Rhodococcus rhodochrous]MCD2098296.1 sulfite exporter TauE/SafE family protein [Rhodococcus rhodochrous]MCD2122435.1 sulfite exporter TauE/SafE family protein [Rhodococcus rhodochrous]MCQ4134149.1 sulfite exporter TauE/SafE family protein [Rhodococcus rhodochrous]